MGFSTEKRSGAEVIVRQHLQIMEVAIPSVRDIFVNVFMGKTARKP
jgi:hypothetical protein